MDAAGFGVNRVAGDSYLLQRFQFHIDAHFDQNWEFFTQFEDDRAFGKNVVTQTDKNPLDLRLAFLSYVKPSDDGTFKARIGRQDFLFDLQRFVSSRATAPTCASRSMRSGPTGESGLWRFIGFLSQPVQYRDVDAFDDTSNGHLRFHTLRVERHVLGTNEWSAYYSLYERDNARYLDASGPEHRNVFDMRFCRRRQRYRLGSRNHGPDRYCGAQADSCLGRRLTSGIHLRAGELEAAHRPADRRRVGRPPTPAAARSAPSTLCFRTATISRSVALPAIRT